MRKYIQFALLIGGSLTLMAQNPVTQGAEKAGQAVGQAAQSAERAVTGDATYGRVKEFTAGQKLVIDINNAPDKNYDLAKDKDIAVAPGLKVGDPVKITERDVNGKKTITIAMDNTPGVEHGDPQR